jgi:release factor glutamine methyltransferase
LRTVLKHIVAKTYKPLLVKYLSKTRVYHYEGIRLEIPPQVFHPGFFFSTNLLLKYTSNLSLKGKRFLELGAGSGLISLYACKRGAVVTATDINSVAIDYLYKNSQHNKTSIEIIESDLFDNISQRTFDIIAINPPYYKKQPETLLDHAWFCGEKGEYFSRLFSQLTDYIHHNTKMIMVLCEGCDIEMIHSTASENGFALKLLLTKHNILEKNFIYEIEKRNDRDDLQ